MMLQTHPIVSVKASKNYFSKHYFNMRTGVLTPLQAEGKNVDDKEKIYEIVISNGRTKKWIFTLRLVNEINSCHLQQKCGLFIGVHFLPYYIQLHLKVHLLFPFGV